MTNFRSFFCAKLPLDNRKNLWYNCQPACDRAGSFFMSIVVLHKNSSKICAKISIDIFPKPCYNSIVNKRKEVKNMKKFFNIESGYKFEWNDLRCFITVINVVLVMIYGLSISWFGLAVAVVGIIKDLTTDRHINGLLMHVANMSLNIYFLLMFYGVV